jgi:hypothetical protein
MANQLYTVKNKEGRSTAFVLSSKARLVEIRKQLTIRQFMTDSDMFLQNNLPLEKFYEPEILLMDLVPKGSPRVIYIASQNN